MKHISLSRKSHPSDSNLAKDKIVAIEPYLAEDIGKIIARISHFVQTRPIPIKQGLTTNIVIQRAEYIGTIFKPINQGSKQAYQLQWQPWLQQMVSILENMQLPTKLPPAMWLQLFMVDIHSYNNRIDVLHQLQKVAPQCFESQTECDIFAQDCQCLCYIYHRLQNLFEQGKKMQLIWCGSAMLNELTWFLSEITPKEMIALAFSLLDKSANMNSIKEMFGYVARLYKYINQLYTGDICEFSKILFLAESFRRYIISGKDIADSMANIHTLPMRLRNGCFDIYIEMRILDILNDLETDNARLYPPTRLEAMQTLLEQEECVVNRMAGLKQFKNSYAYAQQWYPGADDVLTMAQFFLQYLKDKIKALSYSNTQIVTQEVHVQGDYIAGTKQVGTHIGNVSPNAVGIQHNPSTQPE